MSETKRVLVIMGSTRAGRNCPTIARWVVDVGQSSTDFAYEIVDLSAWHLPLDDEPGLPASGAPYAQPHTRAWSEKISASDAVIFVTPQYNWGYRPLQFDIGSTPNELKIAVISFSQVKLCHAEQL